MKKLLILICSLFLCTLLITSCQEPSDSSIAVNNETSLTTQETTATISDITETSAPITEEVTPTVKTISAQEAKNMMDTREVTVVDVRRADEYAQGHIQHAILLPNETITEEAPAVLTDKNAVILIYCRSGRRSAEAANKLISLGYTNVYDFGGILDWPYETVTP